MSKTNEDNKDPKSGKYITKIVILGDAKVGKTSLRKRYMGEDFSTSYLPTLGADFSTKEVRINSSGILHLQIWDLAGQPSFKQIRNRFYKGTGGILMVFDLTEKESFGNVMNWLEEMWNSQPKDIPVFLIANKLDLKDQRDVSKKQVDRLMTKIREKGVPRSRLGYFETSAKFGNNVETAFEKLAKIILTEIL